MRRAELFCTDPETFLCEQCLPNHCSKKRSRTGHPTWPISDLLSYKDPRFYDRQDTFPTIQAQARQGVTEVDRAIAEYSSLVDKVIKEIRASSNRVIEQLKGIDTECRRGECFGGSGENAVRAAAATALEVRRRI